METLTEEEIELVSGGLNWQGGALSTNVIDCRSGSCYVYATGVSYGGTTGDFSRFDRMLSLSY
jgi:hypothetical protein